MGEAQGFPNLLGKVSSPEGREYGIIRDQPEEYFHQFLMENKIKTTNQGDAQQEKCKEENDGENVSVKDDQLEVVGCLKASRAG